LKGVVALRLKSKITKFTNQEGNILMPQYLWIEKCDRMNNDSIIKQQFLLFFFC